MGRNVNFKYVLSITSKSASVEILTIELIVKGPKISGDLLQTYLTGTRLQSENHVLGEK